MPVSVVIACHDSQRWEQITRAIDSVLRQREPAAAVVVAVDHNPQLSARLRAAFATTTTTTTTTTTVTTTTTTTVTDNDGPQRGAGATRNAGAALCTTELIAFFDDDETAEPDWLEHLLEPFADPAVVGTGGRYLPRWLGPRPRWFPDELAWVVGGHHTGMPDTVAPVRNVWSGNMAVRADAFVEVGGFRSDFGKVGARSRPEDTDLCIRVARATGGHWVYVPDAMIQHDVPTDRATFGFYVRRCYAEGRGKIELRDVTAADDPGSDALADERDYLRSTIPRGILTHLAAGPAAWPRAGAIVVGVLAAALGAAASTIAGLRPPSPTSRHHTSD